MTSSLARPPNGIPFSQHSFAPTSSFGNINNVSLQQGKILSNIISLFPGVQQGTLDKILAGTNITIDRSTAGQITINSSGGGSSLPNGNYLNDYLRWDNSSWSPGPADDNIFIGKDSGIFPGTSATTAIAIGVNSKTGNNKAIAIGNSAQAQGISIGNTISSEIGSIVIGYNIGRSNGIAIGSDISSGGGIRIGLSNNPSFTTGGSLCIGHSINTGGDGSSIVIGNNNVMNTPMLSNRIVIGNSVVTALDTTTSGSLYIKPIRGDTAAAPSGTPLGKSVLYYDERSGEITRSLPAT